MPVFETFSKRRDRQRKSEQDDVYCYDDIPHPLRVQIVHILNDSLSYYSYSASNKKDVNETWEFICNTLQREKGVFKLSEDNDRPDSQVLALILKGSTDDVLNAVDLSFNVINNYISKLSAYDRHIFGIKVSAEEAIIELNARFREHSIGYEFVDKQLIQISNNLLHAQVVVPAIRLLYEERFSGADQEIRNAFEHYKNGEFSDAIVDAHSAFESVLKSICNEMGWEFPKNAPGANILNIAKGKGLFPDYLDNSFDQLLSVLKSGLPKVRNEEGGHGQGREVKETPGYVASFALHLAATKIEFLVDAYRDLKRRQKQD
ncbi:hypothetical protein GAY28_05300 [Azospirillum brasilense]|nr:hypothetical protein [Azospirillum brasilense]